MDFITELLIGFLCAIITICWIWTQIVNSDKSKIPPGPWGFPILGHLPLLGTNPALKCLKWKKKYGPIIHLRFGSTPTVVLSDVKLIQEAFMKNEFSGRPNLNLFLDATNKTGLILSEGPSQVEQRKFVVKNLKDFGLGSRATEFRIQEEISKFLVNLKSQAGKSLHMNDFFRLPVINSFWDLILGRRFEENDPKLSEFVATIERATNVTSVVAQLSLFIPWIATWFGFLGYNQTLVEVQNITKYMTEEIESYKVSHVVGEAKDFTGAYLNKISKTLDPKSSFHHSKNTHPITTGDLFVAAVDTTTKTLDWLLIRLARNPEIQKQLQEEIDTVIGDSSSPSISHRNDMPFTEAVITEVLRTSPPAPLGVFHCAMQDVEFHGYTISKDTMIAANIYGVHYDKDVWDEPYQFRPQRFLNAEGKLCKTSDLIAFSFGKRNCVGESFARDQLFLITTNFFQKFSISCTENIPSLDVKFELVLSPHPFELVVSQR